MAKVGRPRKPDGEKNFKNVAMRLEDGEKLNAIADEIEKSVGFRPNISQTLRLVIAAYKNPAHK